MFGFDSSFNNVSMWLTVCVHLWPMKSDTTGLLTLFGRQRSHQSSESWRTRLPPKSTWIHYGLRQSHEPVSYPNQQLHNDGVSLSSSHVQRGPIYFGAGISTDTCSQQYIRSGVMTMLSRQVEWGRSQLQDREAETQRQADKLQILGPGFISYFGPPLCGDVLPTRYRKSN